MSEPYPSSQNRAGRAARTSSLCCSLVLVLAASLVTATAAEQPYSDFSRLGAGFFGPGRETAPPDTLSAVRLGLTGPASTLAGEDLQQGVAMAVDSANARGGYHSLPYQVVFRPDDGPWGVVAHQVVRLACEDQVWAIIGSMDGERAHAAELVAAKLWVPVLTPGAGDRTIDYANVPWMFRCLPDDRSQMDLLMQAVLQRGWKRLAVASEGVRDARLAVDRLQEAAQAHGYSVALHVEFAPYDLKPAVSRLLRSAAEALVICGQPASVLALLVQLRQEGMAVPVLLPAPITLPEGAARGDGLGEILAASPFDFTTSSPEFQDFRQRFRDKTGREPSYIAAVAYDVTQMVITAIGQSGLNRARIRDELACSSFAGLSGTFSFNSLGGRQEKPVLMSLREGRWVRNH